MAKKVNLLLVAIAIITISGPLEVEGCGRMLKLIHEVLHAVFEAKETNKDTIDVAFETESRQPAIQQPSRPPNYVYYPAQRYQYQPYGVQGHWRNGYTNDFKGAGAAMEPRRYK